MAANQAVVAVPAAHAQWGIEEVLAPQSNARDLFDDVDELIDRHQLAGADVDGIRDVGLGEHERAEYAVVDVHEASRLLAVAPDLDLIRAGHHGLRDLAADRGRRLL